MKKISECTLQELVEYFTDLYNTIGKIENLQERYNAIVKRRQKNEESVIKYLCTEVSGEALEAHHKGARTRYACLVIREHNADQELRHLIKSTRIRYNEILRDFYLGNKDELLLFIKILKSGMVENYQEALYIFKKNNIIKE